MKKSTVAVLLLSTSLAAALAASASASKAKQTVGVGDIDHPAMGPGPSYSDKTGAGFVLVKNWKFGAKGTVRNTSDMNSEFVYHDQFGTIANGTNYGAVMVAPDAATALPNSPTGPQPLEDPAHPVRKLTSNSLKTFLVPLNGAASVSPGQHNVGCGSFMAKWKLPSGGTLLGKDILWETRVRMVTPPYFWFALWNAGKEWDRGAEIDLVESFGYDNGGGNTNFDGRFWHSNSVNDSDQIDYWKSWQDGMTTAGVPTFDATKYHTWQLLYRKDNSYSCYVDGHEVQKGSPYYWTLHDRKDGKPVDFVFLFDMGWGHNQINSVNHTVSPSIFAGKFYEFDYSRVYLRP